MITLLRVCFGHPESALEEAQGGMAGLHGYTRIGDELDLAARAQVRERVGHRDGRLQPVLGMGRTLVHLDRDECP